MSWEIDGSWVRFNRPNLINDFHMRDVRDVEYTLIGDDEWHVNVYLRGPAPLRGIRLGTKEEMERFRKEFNEEWGYWDAAQVQGG